MRAATHPGVRRARTKRPGRPFSTPIYRYQGVSMVRFSNAQVAEAFQPFWAALQRGEFITDAAAQAGTFASRARAGWRPAAACARAVGAA